MRIKTLFHNFQRKHPRFTTRAPRLKYVYAWHYKHSKVISNRILFESFHGKDISDSPFYILKALMDSGEAGRYDIYFATNGSDAHRKTVDALNLPVKLVDVTSYKYVKILATSRFLINNSSFPVYFIRKPDQIYLQTWHGTPLKTLGKSMQYGIESMYSIQHNFLHANYLLFPNEFTRDVMLRDYNMTKLYTGKVVMYGYPRNSIFFDIQKGRKTATELGNENYTTLAYMPTWRGQNSKEVETESYYHNIRHLLEELDKTLLESQKLYVNLHPIIQTRLVPNQYKHIFPFPSEIDKYEFLNSIDVLITDYSSILFDYSITRKPIILYLYDYRQYLHDRGTYTDIHKLPFTKIYDLNSLKNYLSTESYKQIDYGSSEDYIRKYIPYDSPDAPKKMLELVLYGAEEGLELTDYSSNSFKKRRLVPCFSMKSKEELDLFAASVDPETDIAAFHRRQFTPSFSSYFYSHYKDNFDFIIITFTETRTFSEEIMRRFNGRVQKHLSERELLRCLPNINAES